MARVLLERAPARGTSGWRWLKQAYFALVFYIQTVNIVTTIETESEEEIIHMTYTQTKNLLNLKQKIEVLAKLEDICSKIEEGEKTFAVYNGSFTDAAAASLISSELGYGITPTNVAYVRREMIGDLRRGNKPRGKSGLKARLTDAETRIDDLQRQATALQTLVANFQGDFTAHIRSRHAHPMQTPRSAPPF